MKDGAKTCKAELLRATFRPFFSTRLSKREEGLKYGISLDNRDVGAKPRPVSREECPSTLEE